MTATITNDTTTDHTTWLEADAHDLLEASWAAALLDPSTADGIVLRPGALAAAVAAGGRFDRLIRHLALGTGVTPQDATRRLIAEELRVLADALTTPGTGIATRWAVSWADPRRAHDSVALFADARAISRRAARPNVMVTIPATHAGLRAFEWLVADGVAVHLAMVPSPERLRSAVAAYVAGLEARRTRHLPLAVDAVVSPAVVAGAADAEALAAAAWHTIEGRYGGVALDELRQAGAEPLRLAVPAQGISLPGDDLVWTHVIRVLPAATRTLAGAPGSPAAVAATAHVASAALGHDDDDAAVDDALAGEVAAYRSLDALVAGRVTAVQRALHVMVGCPVCIERKTEGATR